MVTISHDVSHSDYSATVLASFVAVTTSAMLAETMLRLTCSGSSGQFNHVLERVGVISETPEDEIGDRELREVVLFAVADPSQLSKISVVSSAEDTSTPTPSFQSLIEPADAKTISIIRTGEIKISSEKSDDHLTSAVLLIRTALAAPCAELRHDLDIATKIDARAYIDGWVENAASLELFLLSDDMSVLIRPDEVFYKVRRDVAELMLQKGATFGHANHGFSTTACLPAPPFSDRLCLYASIAGTISQIAAFRLTRPAKSEEIIGRIWEAFSGRSRPSRRFCELFLLPLLHTPSKSNLSTAAILRSSPRPAQLSIVVPLYGEAFFVKSLLAMQQILSPDYEWIFVIDDERIANAVVDVLKSRALAITARTVVTINHGNYGYAASNNIGAERATSKVLLFMNSDVWIRSLDCLAFASRELLNSGWDLLGFNLLFEDDTLQHRDLSFSRNSDYNNLYLAEHPGKGLPPPSFNRLSVAPVEAVTGALLMIKGDLFRQIGGFDERFIKGDFEDADLCLRVRARGGRIGSVDTRDCYHLERQSIRTIAGAPSREIITYYNCLGFNDLWGDSLDRRLSGRL